MRQQRQLTMCEARQLLHPRNAKGSDVPESGDDQDNKDCKTANVHKRVVLSLLHCGCFIASLVPAR